MHKRYTDSAAAITPRRFLRRLRTDEMRNFSCNKR